MAGLPDPHYTKTYIHFFPEAAPAWISDLGESLRNGGTLLDCGCGDGAQSFYLRQALPVASIISLDVGLERCQRCRELAETWGLVGDACAIPLRSNSVDFAACCQVIEHVPDDGLLLQELRRVLKPEGRLLVGSVVRKRGAVYFYWNRYGEMVLEPTHVREYPSVALWEALLSEWFRVESTQVYVPRNSIVRFVYRSLVKIGAIRSPRPDFFITSPFWRWLARWELPVPRYLIVESWCVKQPADGAGD